MKPIIQDLAAGWFPPDLKTPCGKYHYACTYCDQNCSRHDKHDDTCLYQMAKNTVEEWDRLDKETKWDLDWKNKPRDPKEIQDFKEIFKYWAIFEYFIKNADVFVPMDFSDPRNKQVVCSCAMIDDGMNKHNRKCPYVRVSKALHKLYKRTGPRKDKE